MRWHVEIVCLSDSSITRFGSVFCKFAEFAVNASQQGKPEDLANSPDRTNPRTALCVQRCHGADASAWSKLDLLLPRRTLSAKHGQSVQQTRGQRAIAVFKARSTMLAPFVRCVAIQERLNVIERY